MTDTDRLLREKAVQDGTWKDLDSYLSWQAAIEEIGRRIKNGEPRGKCSYLWPEDSAPLSPYSTGV